MRKIKVKPISNKKISKQLEYSILIWNIAFLSRSILELFDLDKAKLFEYVEGKNVKLEYKNELITNDYYPNFTSICNRFFRLANKIEADKIVETIKNKTLDKTCFDILTVNLSEFNLLLKENITKLDKNLMKILLMLASYKTITNVTTDNLKKHISTKYLAQLKTFLTMSKEVFAAILYDMCNYKSFYKVEV